ncbi:MAG: DUF3823 domain-containing protein [Bacteroidales bacterium]|nr:DUF3823 domain-containing protein [Bacteroidales bacterium]
MKKILIYSLGLIFILGISACATIDNYDGPAETFCGKIVDPSGNLVPCEYGGVRIKMMEYSWDENPTPYYMYVQADGTFNNDKVFAGTYGVQPLGPFVPYENEETVKISGKVEHIFKVEPFLNVVFVEEPTIKEDGRITCKIRVDRGTDNPDYLLKRIEGSDGKVTFENEVDYIALFVSETPQVGNNNWITTYSYRKNYTKDAAEELLGGEIKITTKTALPAGRTWWIRAAARANIVVDGSSRYNYSVPVRIES